MADKVKFDDSSVEKRLAVIYSRVSSTAQAQQGTSLETQLDMCRKFAQENGYTVLWNVADDVTGATTDRQGFERVLDGAERGEFDAVIVYDLDRMNRDLTDLLVFNRELTRRKIRLLFVNDQNDDSPQGTLFWQIKGAFGEYERKLIYDRTRRGREKRLNEGKILYNGIVPYGFAYDQANRTLVIDESQAVWVRQMFRWVALDSLSLYEVTKRLNKQGVATPSGATYWRHTTIHYLLHNPAYKGMWCYNKRKARADKKKTSRELRPLEEWIQVPVPPIVSSELVFQALNALTRNKVLSPRNRQSNYLLAGLVTCKICGARYIGIAHGMSKDGRYDNYYYRCWHRSPIPGVEAEKMCHAKGVNILILDEVVWGEVSRQIFDKELVEGELRSLASERENGGEVVAELGRITAALARLMKDMDKVLDMNLRGLLDEDLFTSRMEQFRTQKSQLQQRQGELSRRAASESIRDTEADLEARIEHARQLIPSADAQAKRTFLIDLGLQVYTDGVTARIEGEGLFESVELPLPSRKKFKRRGKES